MPLNLTEKSSATSPADSSSGPVANGGASGPTAWPALIPLGHHAGKPPIPLMRPVTLVGSRQTAHLHLLSRQISKAHALIISSDGKVYIRDLASRTHVYVNGQEVRETDLVDGDLVKVGSFTFQFQAAAGMKQKPRPDETPAGQLEVEGADFPLQLDQRVMLIGRRPSCDISLVEESASTAHAVIFSMNGQRYVRDLGSRTGTQVNGQAVRQQEINFGDTIRIGETSMRYEAGIAEAPVAQVDELEDLVGTAPLVDAQQAEAAVASDQMPQQEAPLAVQEAEPMPAAAPAGAGDDALHAGHADLPPELELDLDLEDQAAAKRPEDTAVIPLAPPEMAEEVAQAAEPQIVEGPVELAPQSVPVAQAPLEDIAEELLPVEPTLAPLEPVESAELQAGPPAPPELEALPEFEVQASQEIVPEKPRKRFGWFGLGRHRRDEPQEAAQELGASKPTPPLDEEEGIGTVEDQATADVPVDIFFGDEPLEEIVPADEHQGRGELDMETSAPLPQGPVAEHMEVIEPTEPTSESALSLESTGETATGEVTAIADIGLSDTSFGRQVSEFAGESAEPILEAPAPVEPVAEAPPAPEPLIQPLSIQELAPEAPPLSAESPVVAEAEPIVAPPVLAESPDLLPVFDDLDFGDESPTTSTVTAVADASALQPTQEGLARTEPPLRDEASESGRPPPPLAVLIPGMPLFDAGAGTLNFVSGLPLVLAELPAPPPTFGRVQVSFGQGMRGPIAVTDEHEPGPFDRVKVDLDELPPIVQEAVPIEEHLQERVEEPVEELTEQVIEHPAEEPAVEPSELSVKAVAEEPESGPTAPQETPFDAEAMEPPAEAAKAVGPPFQNKLRVPPSPRRPMAQPVAQAPAADFGEPTGVPAGFGEAAEVFGGLGTPAHDVDVFSQGLSADLSTDPFFGSAVKGPGREPVAAAAKPRRRPLREPGKGRSPAVAEADMEAMAGQLADALGAPRLEHRPVTLEDAAPADDAGSNGQPAAAGVLPPRGLARRTPASIEPRGEDAPQIAARPLLYDAGAMPAPRRGRRVGILLLVMGILMIALFAVIYSILKQRWVQQGSVSFENFNKLRDSEQRRLQDSQNTIMVSEQARTLAVRLFETKNPSSPDGFLADPEQFARNEIRIKWAPPGPEAGTMFYRFEGADRVGDAQRVQAVLEALRVLDDQMIKSAASNREQIANLRATLDSKQKELEDVKLRAAQAQETIATEPAADQIKALSSEMEAAYKARKDAAAAVDAAEAELKRIEQAAAPSTEHPSNAVTVTPSSAGDPELDELQKNLEQMTNRLSTARNTTAEQAENARKALDNALEQSQQVTGKAQGMLKDNPELSAFVAAAQKLQETTQKLSGDLLDRQQKTYDHAMEEKRYLDERLASRRKELWDGDKEMKRLKDDLGMHERFYNAAVSSGLGQKAVEDEKKQLDQALGKVEQRKMELESDPMLVTLGELAGKRQQEITAAQKQLEVDHKQQEALAKELEKNFAQIAPSVEKLPEAQRLLAQQMTSRMDAVSNARKVYAEALEAKSAEANLGLKMLEEQVRTVTGKVEDRKKALAAMNSQQLPAEERQQRQAELELKRSAYLGLKKKETEANELYFAKEAAAKKGTDQVAAARKAREEYEGLAQRISDLNGDDGKEIPVLARQLDQARRMAGTDAYPSAPKMSEPLELPDRRPLYAMGGVAGIALLFSILFFLTGSRAVPQPPYATPLDPAIPFRAGEIEPLTGIGLRQPESLDLQAHAGDHAAGAHAAAQTESVVG